MMYVIASCVSQLKWNYFTGRHGLFDFEVFDQASRALARIPPSIASLGSLLTITALAISPSSQQAAKYRTEDVSKDDRGASFGVALKYTGTVNNGGDAPLSSSIDWKMQGGVLKGIYNLDLTPPFNYTSSCVWEGSYITLGFGTSCWDVSDATLRTRRCSDSHPATNSQYCNLMTPGGVKLQTAFVPTMQQTTMVIGTKILPPWRFLSDAWQRDSSIVISPDLLNLAEYRAVLKVPSYCVIDSTNYTEYITECTLSLTAYNMSNVSTDGNTFTVGSRQRIPIENAYPSAVLGPESDQYKFNTTPGLPVFNVRFYDWAAIAKYLERARQRFE